MGLVEHPCYQISIHAPHARSDIKTTSRPLKTAYFNPRSSCEERLVLGSLSIHTLPYFNPRSSCEERLRSQVRPAGDAGISIHAPHARSDRTLSGLRHSSKEDFNPRSSCEERRGATLRLCGASAFQSTLLMRGATRAARPWHRSPRFQSTLLMRGATRPRLYRKAESRDFNPRSSCEERPACREHPPRAQYDFNPRSSCEERRDPEQTGHRKGKFQSTLLMRGATCNYV